MKSTTEIALDLSVNPQTVRTWIQRGLKAGTGRVRLRATLVGGRYRVCDEALKEFQCLVQQGRGYCPEPQVELEERRQERAIKGKEALAKRLGGKR